MIRLPNPEPANENLFFCFQGLCGIHTLRHAPCKSDSVWLRSFCVSIKTQFTAFIVPFCFFFSISLLLWIWCSKAAASARLISLTKIGIETCYLSSSLLCSWSARGKSEFLPPTDTSSDSAEMLTSGCLARDSESGRHSVLQSSSYSASAVVTCLESSC